MSLERVRASTLLAYLVCMSLAILLLFHRQFHQSDFKLADAVVTVITLYAVPFSIIVTAIAPRRSATATVTPTALTLLFGSTVIWNALVLGVLAYHEWAFMAVKNIGDVDHFGDQAADDFLGSVPSKLMFLVSAGLTYFFASDNLTASRQPLVPTVPVVPVVPSGHGGDAG
ncbi:MAG: hypothetical protein ABR975_02085 [Vulcanimicrobiaceae bacterium]|jgi:hypothetical protein